MAQVHQGIVTFGSAVTVFSAVVREDDQNSGHRCHILANCMPQFHSMAANSSILGHNDSHCNSRIFLDKVNFDPVHIVADSLTLFIEGSTFHSYVRHGGV